MADEADDQQPAETPPQGASSPVDSQQVEETEVTPQWGSLGDMSGGDPSKEQLGPGPVGPMPAGWPLPRLPLDLPVAPSLSPLETTSQPGLTDPPAQSIEPLEAKFEPAPEVASLEVAQPPASPELEALQAGHPPAPEVAEFEVVRPEVPPVAELPIPGVQQAEALPEVPNLPDQPVEPLGELAVQSAQASEPLESLSVATPTVSEPLADLTVEPHRSEPPQEPSTLELGAQQPEPLPELKVSVEPPPDLEPLSVSYQSPEPLPELMLRHSDFQEIDVESLLSSVQQREEKSFFSLTGIPLLSEM